MRRVRSPSAPEAFASAASARELLEAVVQEFPKHAAALAQLIRARTGGRFLSEWRQAAEVLGLDWKEVALANASYDFAILSLGCSTLAAETPEGPVLARNLDWWPERPLARATVGLWVDHWFSAGWPGFSGIVTGLSERGFALALNAIELPEPAAPLGYPVLLMLRRVLEDARDFDEAVALLTNTRLLASCLLTVVGTQNHQRVVIERAPARHATRWGVDGQPLVATNDFRALDATGSGTSPLYRSACGRYDALQSLARGRPDSTDQVLLEMLTDPSVMQSITVQHSVLRPSVGVAKVWTPTALMT